MAVTAEIAALEAGEAALAVERAARFGCQNEPRSDEYLNPPVLKHDAGKAPVWRGVISYFPRALRAVAKVSEFGSRKYSWGAWAKVETPDRMERYADALHRHLLSVSERGFMAVDPETGEPELAHVAWNALALLELTRRDLEEHQPAKTPINGWDVLCELNDAKNAAASPKP